MIFQAPAAVGISWIARYLDFYIGPLRGQKSWLNAHDLFQKRVLTWTSLHLGLQLNARIYRTFCCSVLSFLWQLEEVPTDVLDTEVWALRRLVPGPGNWVRPVDLSHLQHRYGHPFNFASFHHMSLAAKLRILAYEPQLDFEERYADFVSMRASASMNRECWVNWYEQSHIMVLHRARSQAEMLGVTTRSVQSAHELRWKGRRDTHTLPLHIKTRFQSQALLQLMIAQHYNHEHVLGHKLQRWQIQGVPDGILARRAARYLPHAFELVPARVATVLFRTWFNGWCTARRFQVGQASCLFGCLSGSGDGCHDSIEHYAHCIVVRTFALHRMNMPHNCVGTLLGFLCLNRDVTDDTRTLQLLLLYAVYTATNCLRFCQPQLDPAKWHEFLRQYVHQGASQSSAAQKIVHDAIQSRMALRPRLA